MYSGEDAGSPEYLKEICSCFCLQYNSYIWRVYSEREDKKGECLQYLITGLHLDLAKKFWCKSTRSHQNPKFYNRQNPLH
jgi:hypothetical protein